MNDSKISDGQLKTTTYFSSQQARECKRKYDEIINCRSYARQLVLTLALASGILLFSPTIIGAKILIGVSILSIGMYSFFRSAVAKREAELKPLYPALLVRDDTCLRFSGEAITLKPGLYPLEETGMETITISGTKRTMLRSELGQIIKLNTVTLLN